MPGPSPASQLGGLMSNGDSKTLYAYCGAALLRASAVSMGDAPDRWPDVTDVDDCRSWLREVWPQPQLALAIRQSSAGLARQAELICSDATVSDKDVRRATLSVVRYALRLTGRQMPFGLFAGVAPADFDSKTTVRWDGDHRSFVRTDTQWLGDVVEQFESSPELLDRLDVVFTNLAAQRGEDLEVPQGASRVLVRRSRPIQAIQDLAKLPIRFGALVVRIADHFAGISLSKVRALATNLVRQGFLLTSLRAPVTFTDPLTYVIQQLRAVEAQDLPAVSSILSDLEAIAAKVDQHNLVELTEIERADIRSALTTRMRAISQAGRTPLAVDLRLGCDIRVPDHVADEASGAATALMRLTRRPTGSAAWRDYYAAFCDRYGINALVPLSDVVNPDAGLGLPATYPGSTVTSARSGPSARDEKLLALAWRAVADGTREVVLTDEIIQSLSVGDPTIEHVIPPHVELAVQVRARSTRALDRGDYTVVVHAGRSAGTFTSRSAYLVPEAGLHDAYRGLPTAVDGALPVQLSFPPIYPHAENICRVPAYLPHVLPLGEHRADDDHNVQLDDLAVTATRDGLQLVSLSQQRVVEPQTFHALALEKQPPPLARLLAHLSRGMVASWTRFDWGPAAEQLPYLPRVRYRRSILSPATWRLTVEDLAEPVGDDAWQIAIAAWRERWACPVAVELQDADRSLPLTLTEPAHAAIVQAHLQKHGSATLTEMTDPADFGWIGGHTHDIAMPLVTTRPPAPAPAAVTGWTVTNRTHAQLAASPTTQWLYLKLHTHPERMNGLITVDLPRLCNAVDWPDYWFARYRSSSESDHVRLRLRVHDAGSSAELLAAVGTWTHELRDEGKISRLVIDTYYPENGRYGHGPAMTAAEAVFTADSVLVAAQLRNLANSADQTVLAAFNMLSTIAGFLGTTEAACDWLMGHPAPAKVADRSLSEQVVSLARGGMLRDLQGWGGELEAAWEDRAGALAAYRQNFPHTTRINDVLESLLHMHHNRAIGIDRDGEAICRRLARQAAVTWSAQATSVTR